MAKKAKSKTRGANLSVPQTDVDAADMLKKIGENNRAVTRVEADMNEKLAAIKADAEKLASPMREENVALIEGLKTWAEAHRDRLTGGGKTKTVDLGTGTVSWRLRPAKVTLRGVDEILTACKTLKLTAFIRTTEEINKEAMLADREKAATLAGVTIGSEGEDFYADPFDAEISGAKA